MCDDRWQSLPAQERVETSLASLVAEPSLSGATFDKLRDELAVATRLKEKLGRAVPSLAAGECVVGMTEGVAEHDHERLAAALAAAVKLGVATRLAAPMERARAEVDRLEGGKVLEQALRTELGTHGSEYKGQGTWDHAQIATAGLQNFSWMASGRSLPHRTSPFLGAYAAHAWILRAAAAVCFLRLPRRQEFLPCLLRLPARLSPLSAALRACALSKPPTPYGLSTLSTPSTPSRLSTSSTPPKLLPPPRYAIQAAYGFCAVYAAYAICAVWAVYGI